jgi:hypothetical protein
VAYNVSAAATEALVARSNVRYGGDRPAASRVVRFLGDAKSSLCDAKSSLSDA